MHFIQIQVIRATSWLLLCITRLLSMSSLDYMGRRTLKEDNRVGNRADIHFLLLYSTRVPADVYRDVNESDPTTILKMSLLIKEQ